MSGACGGGLVGTGYDSGGFPPKIKFLCSYGGKILPRPTDGLLKYVGGQTRVITMPRDITCSELMQKVTALIDSDMVLKYQPFQEDLDALVSVRSDEDLKHMFNECYHYESGGALMLRAFLFPSMPLVSKNQTAIMEFRLLEQRYINAIKFITRTRSMSRLSPFGVFTSSSACSSPNSYSSESHTVETWGHESYSFSGSSSSPAPVMQRERSQDGINSTTSQHYHSSGGNGSPNFQQHDYDYQHHNHNPHQHHLPHGSYLSIRQPSPDSRVGVAMGRSFSQYSMGKSSPYHPTSRETIEGMGAALGADSMIMLVKERIVFL